MMEHEEGNFPVLYFIGETVGIDLTTASESGTIIGAAVVVLGVYIAISARK